MGQRIEILGFAGSLRQGSYNRMLLRQAGELLPEGAHLEVFELDGFPSFNQDIEATPPAVVKQFKSKIKSADALLIVTPEYNYSIPGVLKNAVDWASRPLEENVFDGKPVAIMSASTGMLGGARAQYHLRQSLVALNTYAIGKPEVFVTFAREKFDDKGRLQDGKAEELMKKLLARLTDRARELNLRRQT